MRRLFGTSKPKQPAATLDDVSAKLGTRGESLQTKVKRLDQELLQYKQQLAKMPEGPSKSRVKQRALKILQQKRMYESQMDSVYAQQFNIDQVGFAKETAAATVETVGAMKSAHKELKKQYKNIKIEDVERLQDDMADVFDDANEINEALGRAYGVPEDVDETELDAELGALEMEMEMEKDASFLDEAVADSAADKTVDATSASAEPVRESDFALEGSAGSGGAAAPSAPSRQPALSYM
jgi:charged multivesicular body protein 5